jgi:hypothetical protein
MKKRLTTGILIAAALAASGCSSDSKDSIKSDVQSAVTDVSSAISSAATDISVAADDAADDAAEVLARNIATQQGEEQFKNAGQELDGPLTCEATVQDGVDTLDIACTGTTKTGGKAELKGTTSEMPGTSVTSLKGDFTGTVDGAEVFKTDTLGG